jgi:hypothetical protein
MLLDAFPLLREMARCSFKLLFDDTICKGNGQMEQRPVLERDARVFGRTYTTPDSVVSVDESPKLVRGWRHYSSSGGYSLSSS